MKALIIFFVIFFIIAICYAVRRENKRAAVLPIAQQQLKAVKECARTLNSTKDPTVFFPCYNEMTSNLQKLSDVEHLLSIKGQKPSEMLYDFAQQKPYAVQDLVDRYYNIMKGKIIKLSTAKAKTSNANQFYNVLMAYKNDIPFECIDHIKDCHNELLSICKERYI